MSLSLPPQYVVIGMFFVLVGFTVFCRVMVIGILKRRYLKASGWFREMGFSLEASDRDDPPDKD